MTVDVTDEARAEPLQIIIVDVGHGNSAIVCDGTQFAVIDTGNKTQTATVDELDRLECRRIDHLIISHSDVDHVGGAARLILDPDREIGKIWYNSDGAKQTAVWARFVRAAHMRELQDKSATEVAVSITTGTKSGLKFGRVALEVVHPSSLFAGHGPTPRHQRTGDSELPRLETNSLSVVIRVLFGQKPVALLAADMDGLALQHIVQYNRDLAASILIFPHHGGLPGGPDAATFTNQLTSLVAPEVVVFSMEGGGAFSNPRPEVVAAVRQAAPEAHVACTQIVSLLEDTKPKTHMDFGYTMKAL